MKVKKLTLGLVLGLMLSALSVGTAFASHPPTVVPWAGSDANKAVYWETYFGSGYDCTKVDRGGASITLAEAHDALVVKAGQFNYIWEPAHAGTYSARQDVSHYFVCDGPDTTNPDGWIIGPCSDPFYRAVFDNSDSEVAVTFVFRWENNRGVQRIRVTVPEGEGYRTRWVFVTPGSDIRIIAILPDGTRVVLDEEVGASGMYDRCPNVNTGFFTPA